MSFYDLHSPKYKIYWSTEHKKGRGQKHPSIIEFTNSTPAHYLEHRLLGHKLLKDCLYHESLTNFEFSKLRKIAQIRSNTQKREINFLRFSQKPLILGHMLLHKSNINVAIAVILSYVTSLYDLRGSKYKNSWKKGVAPDKVLWWNFVYPNFS